MHDHLIKRPCPPAGHATGSRPPSAIPAN